jgi:hypothetical protein
MNNPKKIAVRTKARFLWPFVAAERGCIDEAILLHGEGVGFRARSRCYGTRNSRTPGKSTTIFRCEGAADGPGP